MVVVVVVWCASVGLRLQLALRAFPRSLECGHKITCMGSFLMLNPLSLAPTMQTEEKIINFH